MKLTEFLLVANLQMFLYGIGALLSFVKFKSRQLYIKLIGFVMLSSMLADGSAHVLHALTFNVNYAASTYYIIVFPFLSWIYFIAIGKRHRNVFITLSILFVLFGLTNVFFIQRSFINSYSLIVFSVFIILYALYYFYWLLKELPTTNLNTLPMFWVNSASILYYSGNLFLFVFTSYLVHVLNNNLLVYWTLHNVMGIIQCLIIIFGLWMDLRKINHPEE